MMEKIPKIALETKPIIIGKISLETKVTFEKINSYTKLASIIGMLKRKEYSNVSSFFIPITMLLQVVLPLLLSPGRMASP